MTTKKSFFKAASNVLLLGTVLSGVAHADGLMSFGGSIPYGNVKVGANVQPPQQANPYATFSDSDDAPIIRPGQPDLRPEKGKGPGGIDVFADERQHEKKARDLGSAKQFVYNATPQTNQAPNTMQDVDQMQAKVNSDARAKAAANGNGDPMASMSSSTKTVKNADGSTTTTTTKTRTTEQSGSTSSGGSGGDNDKIVLHKDDSQKDTIPSYMDMAKDPSSPIEASKENKRLLRALEQSMGTPEKIRMIRDYGYHSRGQEIAPYVTQKPIKRTIGVSLDPGADIPAIHLAYGVATPITFNDISGQPWNISYAVLDRSKFDIQGNEDNFASDEQPDQSTTTQGQGNNKPTSSNSSQKKHGTNTLVIIPKIAGDISGRNLVIQLAGAKTPVNFMLDQKDGSTFDAQVYASVQGRGPNASEDYVQDMVEPSNDKEMQDFIDGVPPKGAHKRKTDNPSVEAWSYNHMLYIRTSGEVFAPGPQKRATSSLYGIGVFAVSDTPAVTVSFDGNLSVVRID